tara:strand:+ start:72 stop:359 length:288 start_codon:yes stop_codon:yes gene_type:complete
MTVHLLYTLKKSEDIGDSERWDATYRDLPVVIAEELEDLSEALTRLDTVGGYGYIATWEKNLFLFNPRLISKRCGLINENAKLFKVARIPKNKPI